MIKLNSNVYYRNTCYDFAPQKYCFYANTCKSLKQKMYFLCALKTTMALSIVPTRKPCEYLCLRNNERI